ncbi:MAG: hypothetical protein ACJA0X_001742 [Cyclobacteriaceae bacterium]|jgi:hypothetical protein
MTFYHKVPTIFLFLLIASSCASYYELNLEFNKKFQQGNLAAAEKFLDKNIKYAEGRSRFLYFANQGVVDHMLGKYEESNEWLEKAYIFGEDFRENAAIVAASFLVNPNIVTYKGEDHENLLLLYYKAINYLKLGDYSAALVECRRLNNRLNSLSDKYKSDNKYREDAFIHNLMGIIYEASKDYNNAFIAYRNAYKIYKEDYSRLFGLETPEQLKKDLLRSAYLTGFQNEVRFYEKEFDLTYQPSNPDAELVFFWHNGLGPIKAEWSINFTALPGGSGVVTFANEDLGFNFPFPVNSDEEYNGITDLKFFRVAFPKYVERTPLYDKANLTSKGVTYKMDLVEDINAIAKKTLQERMLQELGLGLLRAALKKVAEEQISKESEGLGLAVGILNAVTEKADTRNWQTLPHSIYYQRMPLDLGNNEVVLSVSGENGSEQETFSFQASKGGTIFQTYQSLEFQKFN